MNEVNCNTNDYNEEVNLFYLCSLRKVYQEAFVTNTQLTFAHKTLRKKFRNACKQFESLK